MFRRKLVWSKGSSIMERSLFKKIQMLLGIKCRDATVLISKAQDTPLHPHEKWAIKLHLVSCVACKRYKKQLMVITKIFKMVGDLKNLDIQKNHYSAKTPTPKHIGVDLD
jgi:hypothetical protein